MMVKARIKRIFVLLLCASCFICPAAAATKELTNPLLRYVKFRELKPFDFKVEDLIRKEKDAGLVKDVSVYFRSLTDGMWFGIDEDAKFSPASLLKVPVMMAYLKVAETKPEILKIKYAYREVGDVAPVNIHGSAPQEKGQYYSVEELIGLTIRESDNVADNILYVNMDQHILDQVYTYLGVGLEGVSSKEDFVSIRTYCSLFRVLYNAAFLNKEMSQKALEYLTGSSFKDGIKAGLPEGVVVAHKFGERFFTDQGIRQLHEIGIVYYPGNTYMLGIMTRGVDFNNQARVIREISNLVYKEIDAQVKDWRADDSIRDF